MPWSNPSGQSPRFLQTRVPQVPLLRPGFALTSMLFLISAATFFLSSSLLAQTTPTPPPPPPPAPRFAVVLDPAHGGDDTGAHLDSGQLEKASNLILAARLRSLLAARGFQVVMIRDADVSVDLDHRAEIANHAKAIACLSLHTSESGSGIHLFAASLAPVQPARFLPWKTAQAAWETRSLAFAGAINSALTQAAVSVTLGRIPLPGIESMTCPAISIEVGPVRDADGNITTESDNPDYQAKISGVIAAALLEWRSDPNRTETRQP